MNVMQTLLSELVRRGVVLDRLRGLEMFASDGTSHVLDYCHQIASLEAWELDPERFARLQRIPSIVARNVDSYEELARSGAVFDLIIIDAFIQSGRHIEHFDAFPGVLRLIGDEAVVIVNVVSDTAAARQQFPRAFGEEHIQARCLFYGLAEDKVMDLQDFTTAYMRICQPHGLHVAWAFWLRRTTIHYFVFKVSRISVRTQD